MPYIIYITDLWLLSWRKEERFDWNEATTGAEVSKSQAKCNYEAVAVSVSLWVTQNKRHKNNEQV